jgi:phosphatidylserine/phosphatidylglycerophosphate/cardiolipin synthase-like enzyme
VAENKYAHWFDTSPGMGAVTEGNAASFHITAEDAFGRIADDLGAATPEAAWFYLLAWSCEVGITMPGTGRTLKALLHDFDRAGGTIRAMIWDNVWPGNGSQDAVKFLNTLRNAKAILDRRTPLAGAHHQKVQLVLDPRRGSYVGWCGGMDFFGDRLDPDPTTDKPAGGQPTPGGQPVPGGPAPGGADPGQPIGQPTPGSTLPLHDVHGRVEGPGALRLLDVFIERWNDHPDHAGTLPVPLAQSIVPPRDGQDLVQVGRTYPRWGPGEKLGADLLLNVLARLPAKQRAKIPVGDMTVAGQLKLYNFYDTSKGVHQVWRMVRHAIRQAQRYIYLEDQYLVNLAIADELAAKLRSSGDDFRLVILCTDPTISDLPQMWQRCRAFVERLEAVDKAGAKWRVCCRRLDRKYAYIHSKTWVFDDELVICGSANVDRRGYTYQSEADIAAAGDLLGTRKPSYGATTVAQDLRCRLWAKHLGDTPGKYLDPKAGLPGWFAPATGNVVRFNPRPTSPPPVSPDPILDKVSANVRRLLARLGADEQFFWDYAWQPDPHVPPPP